MKDIRFIIMELLAECQDNHVLTNVKELLTRSIVGQKKYGTTLERTDLTAYEWVQHAIEEALDLANYLQVMKSKSLEKDK